MVNSKKKGNIWENKLANWLRDVVGIKAYKDGQSGGGSREKGDVGNNANMTIECKATKKIELPAWWRQVSKSASIHHNTPVLFIHQDGMPDQEWLVVIHSNDWAELVTGATEVDTSYIDPSEERQNKYKVDNLIRSAKEVLRIYE